MDITVLFKACVKTVKTTNKALGVLEQKTNIMKSSRRDPNIVRAREIVKQISNLQTFLLENKAAYLNVLNYLSTNKTMSEGDRINVDTAAEKIVHTCTSLLKDYKKEISKLKISKQKHEHYNSILDSLEQYLKNVSKFYAEAKAVRVKRVIETHKLSKLDVQTSKVKSKENETKDVNQNHSTKLNKTKSIESPVRSSIEEEISVEEMQMFESENDLLYNELNSMSDEVKQIESKVVHIAELQEMFTEKVLQQETDIERIANIVVGSTENMKDANDQIKQVIQRNAGLRVWVLFFLLVMSFSLLFLDWYND